MEGNELVGDAVRVYSISSSLDSDSVESTATCNLNSATVSAFQHAYS